MSGWIKLEKDRHTDPRVVRMASRLRHAGVTHERFTSRAHVTLVLGCLDVLWCYADTHVRDDDTLDLGPNEIDELVGLVGFSEMMPPDWLEILDENRVKLPNFHAHNGTESRRKALAQKRQSRHRNSRHAPVTPASRSRHANRNAPALPDQDLDQDLDQDPKESETAAPSAPRTDTEKPAARDNGHGTRLPDDFTLTPQRRGIALAEGLDAERTFAAFRDYWSAAAGQRARKRDWDATWRTWCRTEADRRKPVSNGKAPRKTLFEQYFPNGDDDDEEAQAQPTV